MKPLCQIGTAGCLLLILLVFPFSFWLMGLDGGNMTEALASLVREHQMGARLDAERKALGGLSEARIVVARRLLSEKRTLPQAVVELRTLMARIPNRPDSLRFLTGTQSDEEDLAWQVILSVEYELEDHPQQELIVARLEAELRDYLKTAGLPASRVQIPMQRRCLPAPAKNAS